MKNIRNVIFNVADILIFIVIMFIKVISLNITLKLVDNEAFYLITGSLGSVLVIAAIMCIFNVKNRVKFLIITDFIISFILFADIVYNRYFYDVTSMALLKQASLIGEVGDSVKALLRFSDFIYFIDIVLLIPMYKGLKKRLKISHGMNIRSRAIFLVVFLTIGYTLSYNSVRALEKRQPGITKTLYDKKWIVKSVGDLNFHMVDFYNYFSNNVLKKEKITESQKHDINNFYIQKNSSTDVKKYTGIMDGKNLIVIQLEAFQGFVLNTKINGQEITPNLNKLAKESLVFDNYYYQTAWGGTSDAEFLSNTSMLPAREGAAYYQYSGNEFDSMIKHFNDKGYFTSVMHANRAGFWNRTNMYKSLGFNAYENENNFVLDDMQGLGLGDKSFFKQAVGKMKAYDQPFYSFLITLSSHFPYKDSYDKIKNILDVGEFEGKLMGDYLKSVKYTDEAIGDFISELKKEGLWDNSVVVFYGDHSAIPQDKSDQMAKLLYNKDSLTSYEWIELQKVVSMIHFPGEELKGHKKITAGQLDLYPTIANLYGFESKYAFGQDLLNSKNGFVVNRNGIWANNNVIHLGIEEKVVDLKTQRELAKGDYLLDFERAYQYMKISDTTLDHNLIKEFEKADQ
jgi:lipoteichoic acid synthase